MRHKVQVLDALSHKKLRSDQRDALDDVLGKLMVIERLQLACDAWPDVSVTVDGKEELIDKRWNVGIAPGVFASTEIDLTMRASVGELLDDLREGDARRRRASSGSSSEAAQPIGTEKGHFCYFCAQLKPPVRVRHPMRECPRRKKANVAEFQLDDLKRVLAELQAKSRENESQLIEYAAHSDSARAQKRELLELAGALKVLNGQEEYLPAPPPPPPPPTGARTEMWQKFHRKKSNQQRLLMKVMARNWKMDSGSWAELKAIAVTSPQLRLTDEVTRVSAWRLHQHRGVCTSTVLHTE